MHIRNFNEPAALPNASFRGEDAVVAQACPAPEAAFQAAPVLAVEESRAATELALLRARIEHLELVVETARGLMTANQERLLRRLHDVPQEMMQLTAKITRFAAADPATPDHR